MFQYFLWIEVERFEAKWLPLSIESQWSYYNLLLDIQNLFSVRKEERAVQSAEDYLLANSIHFILLSPNQMFLDHIDGFNSIMFFASQEAQQSSVTHHLRERGMLFQLFIQNSADFL